MKSRCAELAERVSALADGELAGEELAVVREHLAGCPECRAFAEACRGIDGAVASGLLPPPVESGRWEAMLEQLRAAKRAPAAAGRARFRMLKAAAFAAAVAAVVLLALLPAYFAKPARGRDYLPARGVRLDRTEPGWQAQVLVAPEEGLTMVLVLDEGGSDSRGTLD